MDQTHVVPRPVSRHDDNGRGRLRGEGGAKIRGEVAWQSVLIVKCDQHYNWGKGSLRQIGDSRSCFLRI
jgi:hypothetical protein